MKALLILRKKKKAKKPHFKREDCHKIMALPIGWRKPNGLHSKMRHRYRGQPAMVEPGWGSPRAVKGLWSNGLVPQIIHTVAELMQVTPRTQGIVIGAGVGMRKRVEIITKAQEKKISILNIKNPQEYVMAVQQKKKALQKSKPSAQAPQPTLATKVEPAEEKDKQVQKQELDKLLTKRTS